MFFTRLNDPVRNGRFSPLPVVRKKSYREKTWILLTNSTLIEIERLHSFNCFKIAIPILILQILKISFHGLFIEIWTKALHFSSLLLALFLSLSLREETLIFSIYNSEENSVLLPRKKMRTFAISSNEKNF